jgi:hypothetical protein
MPEPKPSRSLKHDLECLRLAAECKQLANDVPDPALRSHFLRMAEAWTSLADGAAATDPRTGH